jgi:hypothetical protein
MTRRDSFLDLANWLKELESKADKEDYAKVLLGNKVDLGDTAREVKEELTLLFYNFLP